MLTVPFYFDYLSPFSYFAWLRRHEIPAKLELTPVPLGSLLNHWGIKGPGEIQPKREFLLKQCLREAARRDVPFTTPKTHPFNSLYALRLSLKEVAGEHQEAVVKTFWEAGWQKRIDMGEPDELLAALRAAGLPADELYEKSFTSEAKKALKANIARATGAGVFGVPSFLVGEELFWGADALGDLARYIKNEDTLDRAKLADLLASTPRAAEQGVSF